MKKRLRIAMLPHLGRSITRYTRAARSRIIYELIGELVKKGHQVTLIGTEDSRTAAKNLAVAPQGIFTLGVTENEFYRHVSYLVCALKKLEEKQLEFDIVHSHMYPEFLPLLLGPQLKIPLVTTIHTEMTDYLVAALKQFPTDNLVALSRRHRDDAPSLHIKHVIYNGINMEVFRFHDRPGDYLLFVGRIKIIKKESGELYDPKGILTAIEVAKKAKMKLLISGSIESREMYETYLKSHLNDQIKLVGGVSKEAPLSQEEVAALYQRAVALLFPIHWDEPFGLVAIEANACGTPVITFNRGAAPELIKHGVNGFVVNSTEEMVAAIPRASKLDRRSIREQVEKSFSKEIMVDNYEKLYYQVIGT